MKVITEGHKYIADNFENSKEGQTIQFIHKDKPNGLFEYETINDGTTNEEVLEILIDRMYYLNDKFPCRENSIAITKLEEALMWLNKRTQDRINRGVEGKHKA